MESRLRADGSVAVVGGREGGRRPRVEWRRAVLLRRRRESDHDRVGAARLRDEGRVVGSGAVRPLITDGRANGVSGPGDRDEETRRGHGGVRRQRRARVGRSDLPNECGVEVRAGVAGRGRRGRDGHGLAAEDLAIDRHSLGIVDLRDPRSRDDRDLLAARAVNRDGKCSVPGDVAGAALRVHRYVIGAVFACLEPPAVRATRSEGPAGRTGGRGDGQVREGVGVLEPGRAQRGIVIVR